MGHGYYAQLSKCHGILVELYIDWIQVVQIYACIVFVAYKLHGFFYFEPRKSSECSRYEWIEM